MSNANRVGSYTGTHFEYFRLGVVRNVGLGVTANNTVTIPIMDGGVTPNVGGNYIVRRIDLRNSSGTVAAANVSISGPVSGQITSSQGMATVTTAGGYKDFTLSATYVGAGNVTFNAGVDPTTRMLEDQFLYVNVLAAAAANNTVDIGVWGELVRP